MNEQELNECIENEKQEELDFLYNSGHELGQHRLPAKYREPGYIYRPVILTYTQPTDLLADVRIPKMVSNGWEVVYTDAPQLNMDKKTPNNKPNVRKAPYVVTRKSGHKAVWMKIKEETFRKRQVQKSLENEQRLLDAVAIRHTKDQINIKGSEINSDDYK